MVVMYVKSVCAKLLWFFAAAAIFTACGAIAGGDEVSGYPDIDLGAAVEVYAETCLLYTSDAADE